jgi:hypothetical protein
MRRRFGLAILAMGILWAYLDALVFVIGYAMAPSVPAAWGSAFASHLSAVRAWAILCHTAAVLLVALPFAFLINRLYGRYGVLMAFTLTIVGYVMTDLPVLFTYFDILSPYMKAIAITDAVKLV